MPKSLRHIACLGLCLLGFAAPCFAIEIPSSARSESAIARQSPALTEALQGMGLSLGSPVFIRIIKSDTATSENGILEFFVEGDDAQFHLFKTWPICNWSGNIGPKLKQGDRQAPEGFYFVRPSQLNPNSSYHLSFNLGYPNAFDRAHGRTGDYLMVHGNCVSIGCFAMTDDGMEEIYTLVHSAFENGQPFIRVHSFPFPMTDANLLRRKQSQNYDFWNNLQDGWAAFEKDRRPPNVTVKNKAYHFNRE